MPDHRFVPAQTAPNTSELPPGVQQRPDADPGRAGAATVGTGSGTGRTGADGSVVTIRRWRDHDRDGRGHDCRSRYVERFWLGVLGPSATWLLRRLNDELDRAEYAGDDIARVDLVALAGRMGMTYVPGRSSAFARAIQRCVMFDVAHHTADGLAVRREVPTVAERHLRRLPPDVAKEHDRWTARTSNQADDARRARLVARAMTAAGDCVDQVAAQLVAIGVDPATADEVTAEVAAELRSVSSTVA